MTAPLAAPDPARRAWDALLSAAQEAHRAHPALAAFCAFPDDLEPQDVRAVPHPAAALLAAETGLGAHPLARAFLAAAPQAAWRETYAGTAIGRDFLDRFGCYCLIGEGGAFASRRMAAYVVYMPAGLDYPFHHHPAEELYLVLAGAAEFRVGGAPARTLGPGEVSFHRSGEPHATRTTDRPLLAYVLWRNHLSIPPVWTDAAMRARGA